MVPRVVSTPATRAALAPDACDLAILDDVDAGPIGRAGIAPGDGVVAHRAAPPLQEAADDGKARHCRNRCSGASR